MTEPQIIPGAEPLSAAGGPTGVLVLHGFTGNPSSMRGIAEACAAAGHTVELPRLSGHGTTVEDMLTRTWADWTGEVAAAFDDLAARTEKVVVVGLSMGGALTAWLATQRPDVAGLVLINAVAEPAPDMQAMVQGMVDEGQSVMPGIGSDVADPDVSESAYADTPLPPLLSMFEGIEAMQAGLSTITAPALVMTSVQDHVVAPSNSDHLAATLRGPVERVSLERSYHVATVDFDRDLIVERVLDFVARVAAP